jgi:hypothetical protein
VVVPEKFITFIKFSNIITFAKFAIFAMFAMFAMFANFDPTPDTRHNFPLSHCGEERGNGVRAVRT